jgi:hypothetical protein
MIRGISSVLLMLFDNREREGKRPRPGEYFPPNQHRCIPDSVGTGGGCGEGRGLHLAALDSCRCLSSPHYAILLEGDDAWSDDLTWTRTSTRPHICPSLPLVSTGACSEYTIWVSLVTATKIHRLWNLTLLSLQKYLSEPFIFTVSMTYRTMFLRFAAQTRSKETWNGSTPGSYPGYQSISGSNL